MRIKESKMPTDKETIKELKKSRNFWRAKAIQLENYIDRHCVDDSFENLKEE
jgi:hypothetical protein